MQMKHIYFIRHAKSSWADMSLRDFDRPLNKRGIRDAPFMGKLLHSKDVVPDLIVSSPANRALTTATFFAKELGVAVDAIVTQRAIYEANPEDVYRVITQLPQEVSIVLIFGHNPSFTFVANDFSEDYFDNIPTCGVFKVSAAVDDWAAFTPATGSLTEYHYPKQYFD